MQDTPLNVGENYFESVSRPTVVKVNLTRLVTNFEKIRSHVAPAKVLAVIKGNAYGHGLVEVAHELERAGIDYFGVAFVEEGMLLRQAGIQAKILVFGGLYQSQVFSYLQHDLEFTAPSVEKLQAINQAANAAGKKARVHLKIDTGMERVGQHYYTSQILFEAATQLKNIDIIGVYSHFASSEENQELTRLQLERFLECLHFFEDRSLPMPIRHIANSGGLEGYNAAHLDMVRPGIALYGVSALGDLLNPLKLEPVMELHSKVVYFKVVKKGAGVSYGHTWHAPKDTRVVTIPIGYTDGYSRAFSNKSRVLIRGKSYPIIGRICADQLMVNIDRDEALHGEEVILIGSQDQQTITVNELSSLVGTVPHELMSCLSSRVPRVYVR